ncbi:hypothetical protein HanRHA438_Chr16g0756551 [Helianthus annuus]|nr:hypothetical protein HanRHA438_Chr16g0756551 [Helianthus annuus]
MYKSFKHQKTSFSTCTLSPKLNTRTHKKLGFLISRLILSAAHLLILSLSMAIPGDSSGLSLGSRQISHQIYEDFTRSMKFFQVSIDRVLIDW